MSFEYAPISKGIVMGCALSSILVGLFDVKHYTHLQLVPHISRHHQYWRLIAHHFAFGNSSDLFAAEIILYNVAVQIERQFGSVKFASFAVVSTLISTILELLFFLLLHRVGLNYVPGGPFTLIFNLLYQYFRIVPTVYQFRVFGVSVSNKIFTYLLALQLAVGNLPGSAAVALIGILTGQIYRSDIVNIKTYRVSPAVVRFCTRFLLPLVGSTRPPRRTNRALPDESRSTGSLQNQNEEVITTARESAQDRISEPRETAPSMMRQWVDGLTRRDEGSNSGVRVPSEAEITQLTTMFPDIQREVVIGALQRSPNIESAVETLLSSQS